MTALLARRGLLAGLALAVALGGPPGAARAEGPGRAFAGTWYWETTSYVSAGDYSTLIKSQRWLTIRPDGTFTGAWRGTHTGGGRAAGRVVRSGAYLVFRSNDGRVWRARYQLSGSNGLRLDGVLYVRTGGMPPG